MDLVADADGRGAMDLVAGLAEAGGSVEALMEELLVPAQREVGRRWERRDWNVGQEHAATAIADAALALVTVGDVPVDRGHVVVACVEGEWHALAARMAAEIFRVRGWSVTFLGASVPAADLAAYSAGSAPDAVALSCSVPIVLDGARRCIHACRREGFPVLAGGAGFGPDGRYAEPLGADAWAPDAGSGAKRLDEWLDAPPSDRSPLAADDDEQLMLTAAHGELVTRALDRTLAGRPATRRIAELRSALDIALAAIESATLVGDADLLAASASMIERALPADIVDVVPLAAVLEGILIDARDRAPRAAALIERALPALGRPQSAR